MGKNDSLNIMKSGLAVSDEGLLSHAVGSIESEIAQNFKEQGNDYFKGKRYREAQGFYTQGINAKPPNEELMEALLCNRAACNLQLRASSVFASNCLLIYGGV